MVEFSVMLPVMLIILFYSVFLTDLVEVKLVGLEMARYVTWEKVGHRPVSEIKSDAEARFANLTSYNKDPGDQHHYIGITNVQVKVDKIDDDVEVKMTGEIPRANGGGGLVGSLMSMVSGGINGVLSWAKLNPRGLVHSEVSLQVENKIVPNFSMFGVEVKDPALGAPFVFREQSELIYETWKAWPHPEALVGQKTRGADPMTTYPTAEDQVAAQMQHVAYFGAGKIRDVPIIGKIVDLIGGVLSFLGLPPPIATGTSRDNDGPITLRPASNTGVASFSPSGKTHDSNRLGDKYADHVFYAGSGSPYVDSPDPGVDRSRYSLPFRFNSGHWYRKDGGYDVKPLHKQQIENEYYQTWLCRGHYYMGMTNPEGIPGKDGAYPGGACAGKASKGGEEKGDSGLFGGLNLGF